MPTSPVVAIRLTPQRAAQIAALKAMTGLRGPAAIVDFALSTTLAHYRQEVKAMTEGFRIDDEKFDLVYAACVAYDADADREAVRAFVLYDSPDAADHDHQGWLDSAPADDIAEWVYLGLFK